MTNEMYINGQDAYTTYGIRMGDGFLDALCAPVPVKAYVENVSRLKHGKDVVLRDKEGNSLARVDSRELTLTFVLMGDSLANFEAKRRAFYSLLYNGEVNIQIPADSSGDVYHLVYKGKSASYSHNINRTACKIAIKLEEPNPMNRAE